jgi:hypothetical protein
MNSHPTRRLIEVSLPLKAISAQSAREKSIRHGHISTLHIWCVRRPLVAIPDHPPRLLDLFMGGGATGLEALRLGRETHAVELNPVAHLIELCTPPIVYTVARWPLSNTFAAKDKLTTCTCLPPAYPLALPLGGRSESAIKAFVGRVLE